MSAVNTGRLVQKRVARIFLALIFFALTVICSASAFAVEHEYIDEHGKPQTIDATNVAPMTCNNMLSSGWYFVGPNSFCNNTVTINNDIKLIIGGAVRFMGGLVVNNNFSVYRAKDISNASLTLMNKPTYINGTFNMMSLANLFEQSGTAISGGTINVKDGSIIDSVIPTLRIKFSKIENANFYLPSEAKLEPEGSSAYPAITSGTNITIPNLGVTPYPTYKLNKPYIIKFQIPIDLSVENKDGQPVVNEDKQDSGSELTYTISPKPGFYLIDTATLEIDPVSPNYTATKIGEKEYEVTIKNLAEDVTINMSKNSLGQYKYHIANDGWTYNKDTSVTVDSFLIDSSSVEVEIGTDVRKASSIKKSFRTIMLSKDDYETADLPDCDPATDSGNCHTMTFKEDFIKSLENGKYTLTLRFSNGTHSEATFTIESDSDPKPTPTPTPTPTPDPTPTPPEPIEPVDPIDPIPGPVTPSTDPSNTDISAPNTGHQTIEKFKETTVAATNHQQSSAQITVMSLILPLIISALFCATAASSKTE